MILSSIIFEVTASTADRCYAVGDRIIADDISLMPPAGKGLCNLLIPRLLDIVEKQELQGGTEFVFSCKGDKKLCSGVLELKVREKILGSDAEKKDMDRVLKLISRVDFFKNFSNLERRSILPMLSYKKSETGTVIIEKGAKPKNAYIILSGSADVHDGVRKIATLGAGEIFGEMSLLGRKKTCATVTINKPAWIIEIKGRDFHKIMEQFPKAQMFLIRVLSSRLAQAASNRSTEDATVMSGKLTHLPPAELLQMLNASQKTGILSLDLSSGEATVEFWKGELLNLQYGTFVNEEAFYEILKCSNGSFRFFPGDDIEDRKEEIIANFMGLLLEGLQRIDEMQGE